MSEHVLHLVGAGYSGRAVKLRLLAGYEVDKAQERAIADSAGLDGRVAGARVNSRTVDHALGMAIRGVTAPVMRSIKAFEADLAAAVAALENLRGEAAPETRPALERKMAAAETALAEARKTLETWTPTTEGDLTAWSAGVGAGAPGPNTLQGLFTAKDLETLAGWYNKFHVPSAADVEAILGNVLTIA